MSRALTAGFIAASESDSAEACHLIEMAFDGGTVYVTEAGHDVLWNGNTYLGAERVLGIDAIRETSTPEVIAVRFSLAGPVSSYRSLALQEHTHGRACTVRVAFLNNGVVINAPSVEFVGRLGAVSMVDKASENGDVVSTISITAETRYASTRKAKLRRHALEDHQVEHPTDTIHRFIPALQDKPIVWPSRRFWER